MRLEFYLIQEISKVLNLRTTHISNRDELALVALRARQCLKVTLATRSQWKYGNKNILPKTPAKALIVYYGDQSPTRPSPLPHFYFPHRCLSHFEPYVCKEPVRFGKWLRRGFGGSVFELPENI